jgi:hypothetical protein
MSTALATILGAAIGAVASIIVCIINNNKQTALIELRLKMLEEKVDKHNNLVERTYRLEEQTAVQEEKIKVANNRIADLEKSGGGAA